MKGSLRYFSIVSSTSCMSVVVYFIGIGTWEIGLGLWLLFTFLAVCLNQILVLAYSKFGGYKSLMMVLSFIIMSCSTVSCIVGSLYFLFISPISYRDYRLLVFILYCQVCCVHSMASSAEFVAKRPVEDEELLT